MYGRCTKCMTVKKTITTCNKIAGQSIALDLEFDQCQSKVRPRLLPYSLSDTAHNLPAHQGSEDLDFPASMDAHVYVSAYAHKHAPSHAHTCPALCLLNRLPVHHSICWQAVSLSVYL